MRGDYNVWKADQSVIRCSGINFQCAPEPGGDCGTVPSNGLCIDNTVYFCNVNGKVSSQSCTATGKTCGYDSFEGEFTCQ